MSQQFDTIRNPRLTILAAIEGLTIEQLNTVPAGFNNNIIWNLGHMVAAQCGICYKRAGLALPIDEAFFDTYKPGSKPERFFTAEEFEQIKTLLTTSTNTLEADLQKDIWGNYPTWTTRYGVEIHNIQDAIAFLPFHEGLHIGAIIALKKLV
ncbi:DinB family protein [Mucilaginibacter mali]|uniref:DinB family protein n=1 Tax=Mucilaginibacter mali TaxID=2740462 RepID=A0A7D4QNP3_9SPHI|nr:DinB family protein [Mucilaginibacter mali]QKJ32650.1 DinB family protein [Mucilaginibacter mali]